MFNLPGLLQERRIRFLIAGLWNTFFGYFAFVGLYALLQAHLHYLTIAVLTHFLAVTQSYLTQKKWVFGQTSRWPHDYFRFHLSHLFTLMLGMVLLSLSVEYLALPPLVAQALVTVAVVILSYFLHLHFTFRENRPHDA